MENFFIMEMLLNSKFLFSDEKSLSEENNFLPQEKLYQNYFSIPFQHSCSYSLYELFLLYISFNKATKETRISIFVKFLRDIANSLLIKLYTNYALIILLLEILFHSCSSSIEREIYVHNFMHANFFF